MNFKIEPRIAFQDIKITVRKEDLEIVTYLDVTEAHLLSEGIKHAICYSMGDSTGGGRGSYDEEAERYRKHKNKNL